ncbi:MAG: Asp-tRNA(Asn)/Glu-tRNA(Gln) amidotransferase subunit GatC [Endomicrobia bacterium]|nr:Asp-tRNA(Asn)/Glu-tRNA(Gln) amidotransferase subunit GatC [Endomicrobiia bacterium]
MKKITKEDVKHIAYLSRLKLTEEEIVLYSEQLEKILEYMDKLQKADTSNIEPITTILDLYEDIDIKPNYREDETRQVTCRKEILDNAPQKVGNYFKVEKIIE